ncbi:MULTISPECIES: DUF1380 family protein [Pectobacterium]|uniref:DUF1380 family protein n=1 Tax=Pectobacterium TaxID=122277 RepID=UPI00065D010A|nr:MULTISPECIES: DUF1380 family protein [Pectobacterium]AZS59297.1 DUF1380 domain-containing protein [Pectobacterium parmentieri]KMK87588.1 hypothetical protein KCQ_05091 [Pectobacterium atrosepticum ICMP 1526]QXE13121.1 DUF1380 domain-containing protein [Pectobacterium atrosepticum]
MYGTRKQLTRELKQMFSADEPLALLVWTEESVKMIGASHGIRGEEAARVLVAIGEIPMREYHDKGVSPDTLYSLLNSIRTEKRPIAVPANLLESVLTSAEQWLAMEKDIAQDDQAPLTDVVTQALADANRVRQLLAA